MSVFVVLAIVLAVVAAGAAGIAAVQLLRAGRRLQVGVRAASERIRPLSEELQDETAVTAVELESLQGAVDRLSASRRTSRQTPRRTLPSPLD